MKKIIKNFLFGKNTVQKIKAGIGKGILMHIDVSNKAQRILGLDELEIQKFIKDFSKKSRYFFDIGASDGYYSLLYRKHNKNGVIYMFEAQSRFKKEITDNFTLNNFPIDFHHFSKFASDKNDETNVSIDSIFQLKGETLLFKIDVDGGEEVVLKGMKNTLENNNCLFVIETHSKELEDSCIGILKAQGYSTKIINHGWYRSFIAEKRVIEHNRWLIAKKGA